jgi:hypothetical protein
MIKELLHKFLQIFRREKRRRAIEAPEFKHIGEDRLRTTKSVIRYRASHLPKPEIKASHQDISRFFKGKSKFAPWYRRQIKRKVQPEEASEE